MPWVLLDVCLSMVLLLTAIDASCIPESLKAGLLQGGTYELDEVKLAFELLVWWDLDAISFDFACWMTHEHIAPASTSRVGILSSPKFENLLDNLACQEMRRTFRLLTRSSSSLYNRGDDRGWKEHLPDDMFSIRSFAGTLLLQHLEKALSSRDLSNSSLPELKALFLILFGTVIAVGYSESFVQTHNVRDNLNSDVLAKLLTFSQPCISSSTSAWSYAAAQQQLLRTLAHYMVQIGVRAYLLDPNADNLRLIDNAHRQWDGQASFTWQTSERPCFEPLQTLDCCNCFADSQKEPVSLHAGNRSGYMAITPWEETPEELQPSNDFTSLETSGILWEWDVGADGSCFDSISQCLSIPNARDESWFAEYLATTELVAEKTAADSSISTSLPLQAPYVTDRSHRRDLVSTPTWPSCSHGPTSGNEHECHNQLCQATMPDRFHSTTPIDLPCREGRLPKVDSRSSSRAQKRDLCHGCQVTLLYNNSRSKANFGELCYTPASESAYRSSRFRDNDAHLGGEMSSISLGVMTPVGHDALDVPPTYPNVEITPSSTIPRNSPPYYRDHEESSPNVPHTRSEKRRSRKMSDHEKAMARTKRKFGLVCIHCQMARIRCVHACASLGSSFGESIENEEETFPTAEDQKMRRLLV